MNKEHMLYLVIFALVAIIIITTAFIVSRPSPHSPQVPGPASEITEKPKRGQSYNL